MPPYEYVEAPPVTPLPFGLLSAAIVLDDLTGYRQMGVQYEPEACGEASLTRAACEDGPDYGAVSVSVDAAGEATLTFGSEAPTGGAYTIVWGDDETTVTTAPGTPVTHEYAAPASYDVTVTDSLRGYSVTVTVTVEDAEVSGPFTADAAFSKVITAGIDLITGDPFNLYTLFQCTPVGRTDLEQRAASALRLGEQRALERTLGERMAANTGAVDLTPAATALHPVEGLGLLEKWAAQNYGGVPVIHTPRDAGTVLTAAGAVVRSSNGARLETVQGGYVASGGGYHSLVGPDGTPAGDGEAWLYVTGAVVVRRAPSAEATPLTMARAPQATNDAMVLAERAYVVTWECVTAAVLVNTLPYSTLVAV